MQYSVEVEHLTKRFGDRVAVNDVTFAIEPGEVFAFLGPNGSGKSTTIRMLCGILALTSGEGRVLGIDIVRAGERVKQHIGYMSQRFALYEDLTVRENLEFYSGIYGVSGIRKRQRVEELIDMAGLGGREGQLAGQLSGGWKQRLALGCAIVHEPPLLFLDEPTAGVDPVSRRRFWTMIYSLARGGVTIFVTTHYLDEAEHANRVAMIHGGVLKALATPDELKRTALRGQLYNLECDRPIDTIALLESAPGVLEVALYGTSIHLVLDVDRQTTDGIRQLLAASHIATSKMERIDPSLEDVFISLIDEA